MTRMSTSSINFESAYKNADLKLAVDVLKRWLENHPELTYFTFDQISRELSSDAPADHFNRVLLRLVAAGELAVKYRVKFNEGEYSEEAFDSLEEIPQCVFDSAFEPVDVYDENKVPSYAPVK